MAPLLHFLFNFSTAFSWLAVSPVYHNEPCGGRLQRWRNGVVPSSLAPKTSLFTDTLVPFATLQTDVAQVPAAWRDGSLAKYHPDGGERLFWVTLD